MLDDQEKIKHIIEGIYKKLKLYYYYDKTLLHIKIKIAEFEANPEFEQKLNLLVTAIFSNDNSYFLNLINQINFVILPKAFEGNKIDERIIRGNADRDKDICKVNFYIDASVELLIIDLLWTLCIKKISFSYFDINHNSYAGIFKKSLFNQDLNLYNGIDFNSNRCFEPYYGCYLRWRNNALDSLSNNNKENLTMISLDLKSFYYSVNFDFEDLTKIFGKDVHYQEINFITEIVKNVYEKYTNILLRYKKGIKKKNQKNVLPIGLLSPIVLREIILYKIDKNFLENFNLKYYGRYVDDILLVANIDNIKDISVENIVNECLIKNKIVFPMNSDGELCFRENPNIKLQLEKVNCFYFEAGKENVLIDVYSEIIRKASSEANLLPDIELLRRSFNSRAYTMNSSDNSGKIRNLEFMKSDNYNATLFVNGMKNIIKNTDYNKENISMYLDEIMEFYSGSQAIEFSNSWRSVFELLILCEDKNRANNFYRNIKKSIEKLSFELINKDELLKTKKEFLLKKLKQNLIDRLDDAIALAIALDYKKGNRIKHINLARKIRKSNMLNHNMVSFPLINYSNDSELEEISLISADTEKIMRNTDIRKRLFCLDNNKIKWSPRFVHLDELYFCTFFYSIGRKDIVRNDNDEIFNRYKKMNYLSDNIPSVINSTKTCLYKDINVISNEIVTNDIGFNKCLRIGLVNTNLKEMEIFESLEKPGSLVSQSRKEYLFKILNSAKEEKVNYLVFPEFYMPVVWLNDILKFAKYNRITIVTGIQYIVAGKKVYNTVCVLKSICNNYYFKNSIPLFREKNYYAPDEKLNLARLGYDCKDQITPFYYIFKNCDVAFSTILCYEFTDIASRLIMKGNIDILFVPQLNKDTNYFASIVESAARDLHCFVIQANTAIYGDSRITAPFKTDYKDFIKIKGGINELLIVGELDVDELKKFKEKYYSLFAQQVDNCRNCIRVKRAKDLRDKCRNCKKNVRKGKIKGLPPNWQIT
ncbi:Predicted amidohydrolase [Lachnospiraceae bacterium NLAE-zl-G231]|nr:Predicted amidohydrolase [Lachnospiraceae bacterium NLAE-zl-G231]